jgi:hypothetical protein
MPIKGIADRAEGGFAQIGVIRKGGRKIKKYSERVHREVETIGPDLHYFRVEFDERDTETAQEFERVFGKQPTDIMIFLPFPELERCWEYWIETYNAGSLVHQCDGEYIHYAINPATGDKLVTNWISVKTGEREKCPGHPKGDGAKPTGRLRVIVPALKRVAYLVVKTTSWYDCQNITDQLEGFKKLNRGNVAGIPIILKRRPAMIPTPGENGKKVRREKWLISLEVDPVWAAAKFEEVKRLATPEGAQAAGALAAPEPAPSTGPEWAPGLFEEEDPDADELAGEFEPIGESEASAGAEASATPTEPPTTTTTSTAEQPATKAVDPEIATIITQVRNQGGRLYLEDGHLRLNGKDITPTLKAKVRANAKAIAEALSEEPPF